MYCDDGPEGPFLKEAAPLNWGSLFLHSGFWV